jgi:hypothetical protein
MVSSGVVTLNGASIAQPSSFSKNQRIITASVTLAQQNTLSVELRSSPGSFVHILFAPRP